MTSGRRCWSSLPSCRRIFLRCDDDKWHVPDLTKKGDIDKLREKNQLKEFQSYLEGMSRATLFRFEAFRIGSPNLRKEKYFAAIVALTERLPEETIQEGQ